MCWSRVLRISKVQSDSAGGETAKIKYTGLDLGFCPQCPQCGTILVHEEGCAVCKTCGYSKCG